MARRGPRLVSAGADQRAVALESRREPFRRAFVPIPVAVLLWLLLLILCWPIALAALVLYPLVWLFLLPFRIVGIAVEGVLAFLRGLFFLPARLLGAKR